MYLEGLRKTTQTLNSDNLFRPRFELGLQKNETATKSTGARCSIYFSLSYTVLARYVLLLVCDRVMKVHLFVREGRSEFAV
jgi:hypothetical protein